MTFGIEKSTTIDRHWLPKLCYFSFIFTDSELYNKLITKYMPKFPYLFQLQDSTTTNNEMNDWD
jgi:hypothetical protein